MLLRRARQLRHTLTGVRSFASGVPETMVRDDARANALRSPRWRRKISSTSTRRSAPARATLATRDGTRDVTDDDLALCGDADGGGDPGDRTGVDDED